MVQKKDSKRDDDFVQAMLKKSQETDNPKAMSLYEGVDVSKVEELTNSLINGTLKKKN